MKIIYGLALLFCGIISASAGIDLVKDGVPAAEIVLADGATPSAKAASKDLQYYIQAMSSAKLPIVNTPTEGRTHIFVGPSRHTEKLGLKTDDLHGSDFRIVTGKDYVALLGNDIHRKGFPYPWRQKEKWQKFTGEFYGIPDISATMDRFQPQLGMYANDATAIWYAASCLLEQFGIRFYMPYEDGTVIPQKRTLSVTGQNLTKRPHFSIRCYYINPRVEQLSWLKRLGYGNDNLFYCQHTIYDIISDPKQQKAHPEYLAKRNGKIDPGYPAGRGRPKLSNPGLRASSVKFVGKVFEAYPALDGFGIGMPDGFDEIDEEDAKKFPPGKIYTSRFSRYVWDYWYDIAAKIKRQNPDKYFTVMPYGPCEEPVPGMKKLSENIAVMLVTASIPNQMSMPSRRNRVMQLYRDWHRLASSGKLWIWQHYLFYGGLLNYPSFFTKELQKEMKYLDGKYMGKFIECPLGRGRFLCPGITHWFYYLQGKLFWNPDLDLNALMDEYYTLYFGPAAAEMKQFYEYAEEVYMRPESRSISLYAGFLKEKDLNQLFGLLASARRKAGADSVYDRRIRMFEEDMAPLKKLFAGLKRTGPYIRLAAAKSKLTQLDCDFEKPFWKKNVNLLQMKDLYTGEVPESNQTLVRMKMAPDRSELYFGITCYENRMNKIRAKADKPDDQGIFNDEAIEFYIETPERSYFKIAINPNGAVYDTCSDPSIAAKATLPVLWQSGAKVCAKKSRDKWELEIILPTKDFGSGKMTRQYPWGINVCRARHVNGMNRDLYAISPTGGGFANLTKLANLYQ